MITLYSSSNFLQSFQNKNTLESAIKLYYIIKKNKMKIHIIENKKKTLNPTNFIVK